MKTSNTDMIQEKSQRPYTVKKFRKKPVVIQAVQWTGDNLREIIDFTGLHPSANKWKWDEYEAVVKAEGLKIFTMEGPLISTIGDWIIRGVKGEFYPCKPDIFEQTYEPAGQQASVDRIKELEEAGNTLRSMADLSGIAPKGEACYSCGSDHDKGHSPGCDVPRLQQAIAAWDRALNPTKGS